MKICWNKHCEGQDLFPILFCINVYNKRWWIIKGFLLQLAKISRLGTLTLQNVIEWWLWKLMKSFGMGHWSSVYYCDGVTKKCLVNGFKNFESHDLKTSLNVVVKKKNEKSCLNVCYIFKKFDEFSKMKICWLVVSPKDTFALTQFKIKLYRNIMRCPHEISLYYCPS